jgi:hypothetical protein
MAKTKITLQPFDLFNIWKLIIPKDSDCWSLFHMLFAESERTNSRCIMRLVKYRGKEDNPYLFEYNHQRCNMLLALIYLKAIDKLGNSPSLSSPSLCLSKSECLNSREFYNMVFYNEKKSIIDTAFVYISHIYEGSKNLPQTTVKFYQIKTGINFIEEESIDIGSIIKIESVPKSSIIINRNINMTDIGKEGIATLINGSKITAKLNQYGIETAQWYPENATTNNKLGTIPLEFVISFEPII